MRLSLMNSLAMVMESLQAKGEVLRVKQQWGLLYTLRQGSECSRPVSSVKPTVLRCYSYWCDRIATRASLAVLVGCQPCEVWSRNAHLRTRIQALEVSSLWEHWTEQLSKTIYTRRPDSMCVWFRPRLLIQEIQLLATDLATENEKTGDFAPALPVMFTSSTLVCSALGYTRRYRRMFFIQQCLFRHARRYLLVLEPGLLKLHLLGIMPRFRACWRALNRPTGEIFFHPQTGAPLCDLGLTRRQLFTFPSVDACFEALRASLTSLELEEGPELSALLARFEMDSARALRSARSSHMSWQRYSLRWATLSVLHSHPHGFIQTRRARSIKRRRAKRLVRQTQFRFWPR